MSYTARSDGGSDGRHCQRCGFRIMPVQQFLGLFGDPDNPNDPNQDGKLPAIEDEQGTVYPLLRKDLSMVHLIDQATVVDAWAERGDELWVPDARKRAKRSSRPFVCSFCFKMYRPPRERGVQ